MLIVYGVPRCRVAGVFRLPDIRINIRIFCQGPRYGSRMEKIPTLQWAVAAVIHRLRRKAGLSQGQLAGLAGLSEDYISGMERGIQCGSLTAMLHIAAALRMETAELVRLIEAEMRAGPCPPERGAGKPPKREGD